MGDQPTEPGWYGDPEGKAEHLAFWDGEKWTGEIAVQKRTNPWTRWWMWPIYILGGFLSVTVLVAVAMSIIGAVPEGSVLLEEDFGDAEGLPFVMESDQFIEMTVANGRYIVAIDDPNSPHLIRSVFDRSTEALKFETTIESGFQSDQPILESIGCWNSDSGYLFAVLPTGEALIVEVISETTGKRNPLSEPVVTDGYQSGQPVQLGIGCVGGGTEPTVVSGWIDGTEVLSVEDDDGMDSFNAVGFWFGGVNVEFQIDKVLVTR